MAPPKREVECCAIDPFYEGGCQGCTLPDLGVFDPDNQVPRNVQRFCSVPDRGRLCFGRFQNQRVLFRGEMRARHANQGSCGVVNDAPTTLLSGARGPSQCLVVRGGISSTQGLVARDLFDTLPRPLSAASFATQPGFVQLIGHPSNCLTYYCDLITALSRLNLSPFFQIARLVAAILRATVSLAISGRIPDSTR